MKKKRRDICSLIETKDPRIEQTRRLVFLDKQVTNHMTWSIRRVVTLAQYPTIFNMLT